jgi:hypothetical protein
MRLLGHAGTGEGSLRRRTPESSGFLKDSAANPRSVSGLSDEMLVVSLFLIRAFIRYRGHLLWFRGARFRVEARSYSKVALV